MGFEQTIREKISESPMGSEQRNLFKLILGEYQLLAAKQNVNDASGHNIVKKVIESNEKSLSFLTKNPDDPRAVKLRAENEILQCLLPSYLSKEQVVAKLADVDIKSAQNDGQAVGKAMAHFRKTGDSVEGKTVKEAVSEIRSA